MDGHIVWSIPSKQVLLITKEHLVLRQVLFFQLLHAMQADKRKKHWANCEGKGALDHQVNRPRKQCDIYISSKSQGKSAFYFICVYTYIYKIKFISSQIFFKSTMQAMLPCCCAANEDCNSRVRVTQHFINVQCSTFKYLVRTELLAKDILQNSCLPQVFIFLSSFRGC